MTWILFSFSIRPSLPDPLHVALDGNLAELRDLAVLDHDEPGTVGRPMVLVGVGEGRRQAPGVEVLEVLECLLDRLAGWVRPRPLDRLCRYDHPQPPAHIGRIVDVAAVMLLVELHERL